MFRNLFCFVVFTLLFIYVSSYEKVKNAQTLIELFKSQTTSPLEEEIVLDGDLDFSNTSLVYPLGASSDTSCVAYSGVFRGNGYSIKGLKMNNADDNKYRKAGLFCGVKDATVENLVIDSTCFFLWNKCWCTERYIIRLTDS